MSTFERYLTVWVALCIIVGIALGHFFPSVFHVIGSAEIAKVNLPVAVLIWLMIIPMLVKIDFAALSRVREHWRGIGVTLFINWAVKPFSMAFLGWLFIGWLFKPHLPADQINSYIAGLILLAAAPCTAMVFVWSNLSDGEPHFTLSQIALNDVIMVFAYAPIVGLLLGLIGDHGAVEDVAPLRRSVHRGAGHHCADRPAERHCGRRRRGFISEFSAVAREACRPHRKSRPRRAGAVRIKGTPFYEMGLDDPRISNDQLLDAMLDRPILINRPFVVTPWGVRLCRPSETVLDILPISQRGSFRKEDGELVVDASGKRVH